MQKKWITLSEIVPYFNENQKNFLTKVYNVVSELIKGMGKKITQTQFIIELKKIFKKKVNLKSSGKNKWQIYFDCESGLRYNFNYEEKKDSIFFWLHPTKKDFVPEGVLRLI